MSGAKLKNKMDKAMVAKFAFIVLLTALLCTFPSVAALAQVAPSLGTAQSFAVLGGSTVTNTGPTLVFGDLGVSPGTAVTGFPPGTVLGGTIHAADAVALQAQSDTTAAYVNLAGQACNTTFGVPTDLGGLTLVPGVYCFSSSAQLTGALTLDAGGDPGAVWIFEIASTLITASNSSVLLVNGAGQCNDYWQVGSSATLGTGTAFVGNILALTSISLDTNATMSGRALARNGAVTMDSNTVSIATCAVAANPPTVVKAFSPATIAAGGVSTLTITLSNAGNTAATLTAPLTDSLPTGVVVSGNGNNTCGGVVTANAGSPSTTLTGGSIPANGSCTETVDVTAANGGTYTNSIGVGALETSNGSNASPAVASLTVTTASATPDVSKAFSPALINAGGVSTLTITLTNTSDTVASLTAPFTDTLPIGLTVSGSSATNTCGGTIAAPAGGSAVTLTGGSIPANGSCTETVNVTAASGGNYINSIAAGALQTSNGNSSSPAIATLAVTPPSITLGKAFSPASITAGGTSTLTLTLNNSGSTAATITSPLTDTLPTGVLVSSGGSTTCGGSITATAGSSTVTLTGGSIPADGSCTVTVSVTAANSGSFVNTVAAGGLQTSNGNSAGAATATLTVTGATVAPGLSKSFSPASITAGGVSTLTISLSNTNSTVASITAPLIDSLPSGVTVSGSSASNTCGGVVTATSGSSTVTLTGGSIPGNGSCAVTVSVTAAAAGSFLNTLPVGALQTSNGSNGTAAVATLTATGGNTAVSLTKIFSPISIKAGAKSVVTITLTNPNGTVAVITAPLIDNLPPGVVISGNSGSTTCGGTVTAVAGGTTVTLTGGSIPAHGSCIVKFYVTAAVSGTYVNTLPAGALQTTLGTNAAGAVATLTVTGGGGTGVSLTKKFAPTSIKASAKSVVTITLTNPNSTAASLTSALLDTLPTGMLISGNSGSTTCGGTVSANAGGSTVSLTGGSIPAKGSCIVKFYVTVKSKGSYKNNLPVGALQTTDGSNAIAASATLTVN
jgi:uncharacterized repeat protein (TIGR01451 family)